MATFESNLIATALTPAIEAIFAKAVAEVTEQVIAKAKKDLDAALRREIAKIAMSASSFYELERMRDGLTITVKLPASEK